MSKPSGIIFQELLAWSKGLTPWQNEAIRLLIKNGKLSEKDYNDIYDIAASECGLNSPIDPPRDLMLKSAELPAPIKAGQKIKLNSVGKLRDVNALKSDQTLEIGTQLTVIYGENGSGKSGYARVMKKAFRARVVEEILQNVYDPASKGPAKADFTVEENGKVRTEEWIDGSVSPECLGRFAVYDSKCARVYIAENNQLEFIPYGLDIVEGLGAVTSEIKKRFRDAGLKAAPKAEALGPLIDETTTGKFIEGITGTSSEVEIEDKAKWEESDQEKLVENEARFVKLKATSPQTIKAGLESQKANLENIISEVKGLSDAMSTSSSEGIKKKSEELRKLEDAVSASAKLGFGEGELPGIGSDVWRQLFAAAERYSTESAYPGKPFPVDEDGVKCVLCMQVLGNDAKSRFKRFWDFVKDDTSSKRDMAKDELEKMLVLFDGLPESLPKGTALLAESLKGIMPNLAKELNDYYLSAGSRAVALKKAPKAKEWPVIPEEPKSPLEDCRSALIEIEGQISKLTDESGAQEIIDKLELEIAELLARKRFNENLTLVLDHQKAIKLSATASAAAAKITTTAISNKASELNKKYVTDKFKKRVEDELAPIGLVRVKAGIDKKTIKGKVMHRVTVAGATGVSPEAVFSEGERTAVSLCCFLAELGATDENSGIILDDPLSSLDHRIRESVVARLVAESKRRQVIIFTHDLVFYRELLGEADRQKVFLRFQNVEALGKLVGIVSKEAPWSALKVGRRVPVLEQALKRAKDSETAGTPEAFKAAFRDFYGYLRSTWERSVEELLFHRVIERLEPEVKTRSLVGVEVDSTAIEAVFTGMKKSSAMIVAHDHAIAENKALPTTEMMEKDLASLKAFIERQKKISKEAEKKLEHLK